MQRIANKRRRKVVYVGDYVIARQKRGAVARKRDVVAEMQVSAGGERKLPGEDCRAQLHRILNSIDFPASDRERRFLRHVVEEFLSGRGDRIKAYSIATEVFGRDVSFDPQLDPVVRIEAGHLRRSLERYYLTAGQADPIVVTIPKGGYLPAFTQRLPTAIADPLPTPAVIAVPDAPAVAFAQTWRRPSALTWVLVALIAALAASLAWWWSPHGGASRTPDIPRLLVDKFEDLTGTDAAAAVATGLRQEVVSQLSKFKDIVVMESSPRATDSSVPAPRFVLSGSVNLSTDAFRLRVQFVNRVDGAVLWAETYDGGMRVADMLKAQADIASNVATTLAQTYGIIFSADASRRVESSPDDWIAYSCTLSFYAYWTVLDPETRTSVRACLEKSVERFPNYATAWGLLSLVYIDDYRFQFPDDPALSQDALQRAIAAATRAVDLDPRNIRGLHARMLALYFNGAINAALAVGKQALAINPNDVELIGEYGSRLALSGRWQEGCVYSAQARERDPGAVRSYDVDLAVCSYFTGDNAQAVTWIKKTTFPNLTVYHLAAAAIFGEAGLKSDAERERAWLVQNAPALVKNIRQAVTVRLARPQDVDFFLGSLKKAGLDIPD
jgi:TolB-like protein